MSIQANELKKSLDRLSVGNQADWIPRLAAEGRECITLAVTSGKGGVGKTHFSLNLALALQELSKRVLLVDTDLGLSNIDIMLGISPPYSLSDVLFDGLDIRRAVYSVPAGLEILPARNGLAQLANLDPESMQNLIHGFKNLEADYDFMILDTGAGIHTQTTAFVLAARETILILTPDPTSLVDAYSMIKLISRHQPAKKIHVLINMVKNAHEADHVFSQLTELTRKFLKKNLHFLGFLTYDSIVVSSIRHQKPGLFLDSHSRYRQDLLMIRQNLTDAPARPLAHSFSQRLMGLLKTKKL
ncbi:MAG: MinD/ParA family protein [Candidatus Delongbacteria bacterium]|nr:MinD/ParA family protein [Candidatus Delongbacteria bacterium]